MSATVYIPGDAAAVAMGADAVARAVVDQAKARRVDVSIAAGSKSSPFGKTGTIRTDGNIG